MIGPLCALVAAVAGRSQLPQEPVVYSAERLTIDPDPRARRVLLEEHVRLERGDLVVTGDRAVGELAPPGAPPRGQKRPRRRSSKQAGPVLPDTGGDDVRRFTVDGHVHVERQGRTADGSHAEYDGEKQTLLLTGVNDSLPPAAHGAMAGPILRDGHETLAGERILLHLENDDVDVVRPRLVLHRSEGPAQAGKGKPREGASQPVVPVRVEAQSLKLDASRRVARFSDDVVVHRGDVTVRGPLMDARYDKAGDLTQLLLSGGVELLEGERRATGKAAVYDASTRKVVLTGNPTLYDRGDQLAGERIEMALDSHEVKVDRARGRIRPEVHEKEEGAR
ncbi:MAG TPA: LptA/OstA family protein [Myxococcales bacterium]|nr:LptA/OstA family protein [Myxococcales bacterium]